jgi:septum formation protein
VATHRIVLASGSPRRRELLARLGIEFEVWPADIDETGRDGEDPVAYVRRLSAEKARAVPAGAEVVVIAADTTVDLEGRILGKPADADEARVMLQSLSARTHQVHTGVTVALGDRRITEVVSTLVTFSQVSEASIDWYIATGEPFDKAGGYGLQGAGGVFVVSVSGSVSNVVGLPLATVVALAGSIGVDLIG